MVNSYFPSNFRTPLPQKKKKKEKKTSLKLTMNDLKERII